jgi:uncharacterized protein YlbG (UPF0298 family)
METAPLQKGLVLMLDNKELIEEGMGFGVPVVKYADKTYFSTSATVLVQKNPSACELKKTFVLDAVSRKLWRNSYINDEFYSVWQKRFAKLYLTHKELSQLLNKFMELREIAKVKTEFIKVKSRGTITVNYEVHPTVVNVRVDYSDLMLNACQEVLVLNEQGSTIFGEYFDTSGLKLAGNKIGAWTAVSATRASLLNQEKKLSFSLPKNSGATLFRGYEKTRNRFSWAGLSYSMAPNHGTFDYSIRLDYTG